MTSSEEEEEEEKEDTDDSPSSPSLFFGPVHVIQFVIVLLPYFLRHFNFFMRLDCECQGLNPSNFLDMSVS